MPWYCQCGLLAWLQPADAASCLMPVDRLFHSPHLFIVQGGFIRQVVGLHCSQADCMPRWGPDHAVHYCLADLVVPIDAMMVMMSQLQQSHACMPLNTA